MQTDIPARINFEQFDWKTSPGEVIDFVTKHSGEFFGQVDSDSDFFILAYSKSSFTPAEARLAYKLEES